MRKKKGFTLIELLAVIVILSVIALISVPLITGIINNVRRDTYKENLREVLNATELYIATNEFGDLPDEGLNITDTRIEMKNKDFTSGRIIKNAQGELELDKISNGVFCGAGTLNNLVIIEGSCDELDTTPPTINIASNSITSNSVTIVASGEDLESGISGYEFSSDNGVNWTSKQTSNVYTFTGLSSSTEYTFKVRVYNNNNIDTISEILTVITNANLTPTYSVDITGWSQSKIVTINYPERQIGYIYEYSLDGASTWTEVTEPDTSVQLTFNTNGSVIGRVSDGANVVNGSTYEVINIDTTAPVITVDTTNIIVPLGSNYTDSGVMANDDMLGDITESITTTGAVNTSVIGTYTLTYNVIDLAGNAAVAKTRTVDVVQSVYSFDYTGNYQSFTVPYTGIYTLEVWGAQGGGYGSTYGNHVGKGGYSYGEINVTAGEILYVYVGEKPQVVEYYGNQVGGWNGGGRGGSRYGAGGGGGTDIRLGGTSLNDRIIVAGGGGGSYGGDGDSHGGGLNGIDGNYPETNSGTTFNSGGGGTQTAGGAGGIVENPFAPTEMGDGGSGTLGHGGDAATLVEGGGYAGGGGGGYYGGGAGAGSDYYGGSPGGGGSGYIGGVTNGVTKSGDEYIPNPEGGTQLGKTGHGYARITFVSQ